MKKYTLFQKVMALALTAILVIGMAPNVTLPVTAAEGDASLTVTGKVADTQTLNNWQDYYGKNSLLPDGKTPGISTWKAGGVWTDKSVFADDYTFTSVDPDVPNVTLTLDDENDFLVSLSALASNKEVVGQSTAPTDTMLVLDVSGSMDDSDKAEAMVEAANRAIDALLKQNKNNRVGVMLYSGTRNDDGATATTLLLPLDHYTTTSTVTTGSWYNRETIPAYLNITDSNQSPDVYIASGVRDSNGNEPDEAEREVKGATYIQRGLFDAWKEFETITDVKVPEGNTQAGTQRTPVMILMSDGRPTLATEDYNNVGLRDSEHGNGSENTTTHETVFLTQLTAAWVKGAVTDHYGTDMKFYSLGMGTGNDTYATNVLYPSGTTNSDILEWWTNFQSGTNQNGRVLVEDNWGSNNDWDLPYDTDRFATGVGRSYIDRYWAASNVSGMISAFQEIVEEIGIQSAYSATLVESGEADLDGYITVEDELGSMMVVKDVKGLLINGVYYDGSNMAAMLLNMGSYDDPTEYGNVFVRTVKERLGIADTSVAQQLIGDAYEAGQISYTSETQFSNYIGWYGGANNEYLGFWQESYGYDMANAPAGTKYINKSYGYVGAASTAQDAADMMHVIVMVHTEIATGHQTVLFKVPSSLIPMITYKVEMEGDSLETAENITLSVTETDPIRLVYEVGLPSDVNDINIEQKVEEYLAKGGNHIHKDEETGAYTFYANSWDDNHDDVAPVISELSDAQKEVLTESVAESHFIPNTANERYYIQENSTVYVKSGNEYVPVTSQPAAGTTYYFVRTIVTVVDGVAKAEKQYEALYPATVATASNFQKNETTGYWEVKAGTPRQSLSYLSLAKQPENYTDTLPDSDHLWVYIAGSAAKDNNIYSFLGNNGKFSVIPATGLKVTKDVTELANGASADEKFDIQVLLDWTYSADNVAKLAVTDADGNALSSTDYTIADSEGKILVTVKLADGESAYITGIPNGTTYTVTEAANENYTYAYTGADETVAGSIVEGVVTNTPVQPGNLYITKEINSDHTVPDSIQEESFEIVLNVGADLAGKTYTVNMTDMDDSTGTTTTTTTTVAADGTVTLTIKARQTLEIIGLPAGTVVTVVENLTTEQDAYFDDPTYRTRNHSGAEVNTDPTNTLTITGSQNSTAVITNTYVPKSTTVDLDIDGTKNFDAEGNEDLLSGGSFTFKVQQWNGEQWVDLDGMTAAVAYAAKEDGTKTFKIEDVLSGIEYKKAGTYTYQVLEVKGSVANVTYDRTLYTFTVTVTDVDGQLVATVTDLNNAQITDGTYEVVFENTFHTAPVSIDIVKEVEDTSKNPLTSKAGFEFVAVQTDENWAPLTGDDASTLTVYSDGAGEARVSATYKEAGSYYYVVSETDKGADGWDYSDAQYKIEVVVTKDEATGDLSATLIIDGVDQQSDNATITFENTYDPTDAQVDLNVVPTVLKSLEGRTPVAGEFTFAIFKDGEASHTSTDKALMVGTNDASGNVSFTATAYGVEQGLADAQNNTLKFSQVGTYYFDVTEIQGDKGGVTYDAIIYDMVVEVTDNGDGTLKAVHYFEDATTEQITFKNTYTTEPTEVVIEGLKTIKVLSGQKILDAGEFTFGLYATDDQGKPVGEPLLTTKNLANGSFKFDAIKYTSADVGKTFTYVVMEIAPDGTTDGSYSANGMDYSGASFTVTVTVYDNGDGTLRTEVVGNGADTVKFVNEYSSKPVSVVLEGTKTLNGRDLTEGEFKFALYSADKTFTQRTLISDQITHDADGKIKLDLGTLGLGYHYFVVKEVIPETRAAGIHYDADEYHITVLVTDKGIGQMAQQTTVYHPGNPNAVNPAISFVNEYKPEDGEITLSGTKTYNGGKALTDDVFYVGLYATDDQGQPTGEPLQTVPVKADGSFTFEPLAYTAADVGETFTYAVAEIIPEGATENEDGTKTYGSNIYDTTIYTVTVTVADDDKDGTLEITKTVGGTVDGPMTFTNTFVPDPIDYVIQAEKTYEKGLKGNDFKFKLTSADDKTNVEQTKYNDADGNVTFDKVTFSEVGTYTFYVEEIDKLLGFINYSTAKYLVTIEVVNIDGVLSVVEPITVKNVTDNSDGDLTFVNTYKFDGEGEVTLRGTKKVIGDRTTMTAGEFKFGLYDEAGKLVDEVENDASGNFVFKTLKFDETHAGVNGVKQYTYTIKEIPGSDPCMTYDTTTVYTVVITVKDNDQGSIDVSYTVNGKPSGEAAISFTNTYTDPEDVLANIYIQKKVVNKTESGIGLNDFTFVLEHGSATYTDVSDAEGKAGFQITLAAKDIGQTYEFKVYEKRGNTPGVTYDNTAYTVVIKVEQNPDGSIKTIINDQVTNGVALEFTNTYEKPETPVTGDDFPLIALGSLLLISGAALVVLMLTKKRKPGKYAG